ncbi:MAG: alpha/beta hydrolase [Acidobacteriota bacterium]
MSRTVEVGSVWKAAAALALAGAGLASCAGATAAPATAPATPAGGSAASAAAAAAAPAPKALMATSPDGTRIAYEMSGSGPALILLSGPGQNRKSWADRGYVERLSKRFTVITPDPRGGGESDKPRVPEAYALDRVLEDILAVADAAKVERFHIWGFGHGATIGRYLAARSDRVISAVLVGAGMGPTVTGLTRDAIAGMRAKWQPLMEAERAGTLDQKGFSPGDRAAWAGGIGVSALALGALLDYPPLEPAEIKAKTLWVVGGSDDSGVENARAYEEKLAGTAVTLKLLTGVTYSDSFGKSELVLPEVEPFLAGSSS